MSCRRVSVVHELDPLVVLIMNLFFLFYFTVKHLPDWLPGAGFKKTAARWKRTLDELTEKPYAFTKQQMVRVFVVDNAPLLHSPYHTLPPGGTVPPPRGLRDPIAPPRGNHLRSVCVAELCGICRTHTLRPIFAPGAAG